MVKDLRYNGVLFDVDLKVIGGRAIIGGGTMEGEGGMVVD